MLSHSSSNPVVLVDGSGMVTVTLLKHGATAGTFKLATTVVQYKSAEQKVQLSLLFEYYQLASITGDHSRVLPGNDLQ